MPSRDALTEAGAHNMARQIQNYWWKDGYAGVKVWPEPISETPDKTNMAGGAWSIRSNLLNGLPRGISASDLRQIRRNRILLAREGQAG